MSRVLIVLSGPALACGLALAGATPGYAQPRHGGHGFAHHGQIHHGHGFAHHGHGFHHHGGFRFGLSVGFGSGFGYGYGYPYGYGSGLGFGSGFGYPAYYPSYPAYYTSYAPLYASYPAYSVGYTPPVISTVAAADVSDLPPLPSRQVFPPAASDPEPAAKPVAATIEVRLPDADANVWVDGRETRAKGKVRLLMSPELVPGKAYGYKVIAAWTRDGKRVAEEKLVEVAAGKTSVADFTRAEGPDALPFPKERPPVKVPDPK